MNRVILFGVACFFAVAAVALLGTQSKVVAGHGCSGCHGGSDCDGAEEVVVEEETCSGNAHRCGLLERLHRHRCSGERRHCHAKPSCCGEEHAEEAAAEEAPAAPAEEASFVAPARVRFVRFRR